MQGSKRKKKHHEEEHINHERWMVSYADMLTLLMVLFIVLFAISQVDQKKFAALKNGLAAGFGAPAVTVDGGTGAIADSGDQGGPIGIGHVAQPNAPQPTGAANITAKAVRDADRARQAGLTKDAQAEADRLAGVQKAITAALKAKGLDGKVRFKVTERGLVVAVVTDEVVFAGDSAALRPGGARVLDAVGPTLRRLPNGILVEGHTNNLGVANPMYPTLWELSVARAATVVRYLIDHEGIAGSRLEAAGFGKERPLYKSTDPRAITQNRRVEITVLSTLPPESRALLPKVAG